jgi:hypothetical protein
MSRYQPPHKCAAYGCQARIPVTMLMCPGHWAMVSKATQKTVLEAYRAAPGGRDHRQAILAAQEEVATKERERKADSSHQAA